MNSSSLIAFAMSTLGYESLSKGLKCVSFNHTFYNNDLEKNIKIQDHFGYLQTTIKKLKKKF